MNRSSEYNSAGKNEIINDQKSPRINIKFGSSGPEDNSDQNWEAGLNNTTNSGLEM